MERQAMIIVSIIVSMVVAAWCTAMNTSHNFGLF